MADPASEFVPLVVVGERAAYLHSGMPRVGWARDVLPDAARLEAETHPRWAVPSAAASLRAVVESGVGPARSWDLAEGHRLLNGGWAAPLGHIHAALNGLAPEGIPHEREADLFDVAADLLPDERPDDPVGPDGYLRADAFSPGWADRDARLLALAELIGDLARIQRERLATLGPRAVATAHSESAAAVLCLELERDGLPIDRARAEELVAQAAGPRPTSEADAARIRAERDAVVLRHAPGRRADLRNPAQVRDLLAAAGVEVATTRKWVLEPYRATHPLVAALLDWRKDERIATTYGYRWLDEHVGADDRLRGAWTACDGAAGRMTAQAGLHNLPTPLRPAVAAHPGHVFVRADLGQIEPRVLAAVSGDPAFAEATLADDLYAPVAAKLRVERSVAKIAVLAAMYGQRSGAAGEALRDLQRAYPVAMGLLDDAYAAGLARRPLRTFGGRLIRLDTALVPEAGQTGGEGWDAARGRFARNAIIQGAAAELFKAWAATVRHLIRPLGGQIVLCLHDELLVHVPAEAAEAASAMVHQALADSSRRWVGASVGVPVRFVAEVSVIHRWDEAKG
jgi:DNA polymerase-1